MTTAAIVMMSVSVFSILGLFVFCLFKVLTSPMAEEEDKKALK